MTGSRDARGVAAGFASMAIFGSLFVSSDVVEGYPIAAGQALRFGVSALVLAVFARAALQRPTARDLGAIAAVAATGVVGYNIVVLLAVRETDPATVGVIVSCLPVVIAVTGPLLTGRRVGRRTLAAAALVTLGAFAVQYTGAGLSAKGLGLSVLALACEAALSLLAIPAMRRLSAVTVATYACAMAVPMLVAAELVFAGGAAFPLPTAPEAAALAYLAIFVTPASFVLWYYAIGAIGVERSALFAGVLPVSALFSSVVLGATDLTPLRVLGTLVVAAGIVIGMRKDKIL